MRAYEFLTENDTPKVFYRAMSKEEANDTLSQQKIAFRKRFKFFSTDLNFIKSRVRDGFFANTHHFINPYEVVLKFEILGSEHFQKLNQKEFMLDVRKTPLIKVLSISTVDNLTEMAIPNDTIKSMVFYHGTSSETMAKNIMQSGIQPPDLVVNGKKKNSHLTPVEGKVYITPKISYALMYAMGVNAVGNKEYKVPYEGNETVFKHVFNNDPSSRFGGRYGYIFKIDGNDLVDIQPDEDEIGAMLNKLLSKNKTLEFMEPHEREVMEKALLDERLKTEILNIARQHLSDGTLNKVREGEYSYYAKAGKVIVKRLSDMSKLVMAQYGFHVAHTGAIIPSEVWKVDKAMLGYFSKDGSNFFDLAEKIN